LGGNFESALASMRIRVVLHPTMVLTFADRVGFLQYGDRPSAQ
jgi:hypothetical protein